MRWGGADKINLQNLPMQGDQNAEKFERRRSSPPEKGFTLDVEADEFSR